MVSLVFGLDEDTEEVFETGYEFLLRSKSAFFNHVLQLLTLERLFSKK